MLKTEHSGAKHGRGAFWGRKVVAKRLSRKLRRQNDLSACEETEVEDSTKLERAHIEGSFAEVEFSGSGAQALIKKLAELMQIGRAHV